MLADSGENKAAIDAIMTMNFFWLGPKIENGGSGTALSSCSSIAAGAGFLSSPRGDSMLARFAGTDLLLEFGVRASDPIAEW